MREEHAQPHTKVSKLFFLMLVFKSPMIKTLGIHMYRTCAVSPQYDTSFSDGEDGG